jgi:tetratricopeptide (TPR) repeat protein
LKAIEDHGLAAYLVAAPLLERKLLTGRHAVGEPECPEGVAVVYAAIDWARCGRTDPIADETLRELWPSYLRAGVRPTDDGFKAGLDWALRPVAGTIALLLEHADGYRAYDYIVWFVHDQPDAQPPLDAAWASAIDGVTDAKALSVGARAYLHGRYDDAVTALKSASRSSADEIAAIASFNLGVMLAELDRWEEALVMFEEVLARYRDAPEPALREPVARALVNKGAALGELGRVEEALAAYEEVVVRYDHAPESALREQVARALVNKGAALAELCRWEEALAIFEEVLVRYRDPPEPTLREQVAKALVNRGAALCELCRWEEALAVFEEVVVHYGDAPEPALREQVANALFNKGAALGVRPEALAVFEEVVVRYDHAREPELRERVAAARRALAVLRDAAG